MQGRKAEGGFWALRASSFRPFPTNLELRHPPIDKQLDMSKSGKSMRK